MAGDWWLIVLDLILILPVGKVRHPKISFFLASFLQLAKEGECGLAVS
jgi:hypothetical protein